jgi:hypothetical protein
MWLYITQRRRFTIMVYSIFYRNFDSTSHDTHADAPATSMVVGTDALCRCNPYDPQHHPTLSTHFVNSGPMPIPTAQAIDTVTLLVLRIVSTTYTTIGFVHAAYPTRWLDHRDITSPSGFLMIVGTTLFLDSVISILWMNALNAPLLFSVPLRRR